MRRNTLLTMARGDAVRPLDGSFIDERMRLNARWLLSLDPDRLLAPMRAQCGLNTLGAKPYRGWKDYYQYYVRALCNLHLAYDGRDRRIAEEARRRAIYMTEVILQCQWETGKRFPIGFITPEMEQLFSDRMNLVRDSVYSHTHIEAVMYVVHKVMVNLVRVYTQFGMKNALEGAKLIAARVYDLMSPFDQARREQMTNSRRVMDFFSEAGGIMDGFLLLYEQTGDPRHLETANFFRRSWFDRMFLEGDDRLGWGMEHANSEMPYVEALADQYILAGDADALRAAREYMRVNREGHELPQGGVSGRSAFPDYQSELYNYHKRVFFHIMDTALRKNITSGESCCSHNLNRVAKKLLEVEPSAELMDDWERRYVNAVLAQQNPDNGMFIYNLNLKNNTYKMWGYPDKSFWCCYGTGAEVFSSLTEGAFYENAENIYACLYMPCAYVHAPTGLCVTERTRFPDDGAIEFEFGGDAELTFWLRLPGWLAEPARLTLPDGEVLSVDAPGSLYPVKRRWRYGDRLRLELPFALRWSCMPDRQEYVSLTWGPNLLVPCGPGEHFFPGAPGDLVRALEPAGAPCTFVADFQGDGTGGTRVLKPLRCVKDETYSGYVRVACPPERRIADAIDLGSAECREAHGLHGVGLHLDSKLGHARLYTSLTFFSEPGEAEFTMASRPDREMLLRLYLDGSSRAYVHQFSGHVVNPLFDLQVYRGGEWRTFSTKSMEGDYPGEIYYEDFVIPRAWTEGESRLLLRLRARNFHEIPGVIETLVDRIELYSVDETCGLLLRPDVPKEKDPSRFVANAEGLY